MEKPKSLMMIVEKEFTTPFGIALNRRLGYRFFTAGQTYAANTEVKRRTALGSTSATSACCRTNFLFLIPVSLPATRFTATRRSRLLKKRAFDGASGRTKKMMKLQRQVAPPSCRDHVSYPVLGLRLSEKKGVYGR